jgi:hypothetical protein
LVSLRRRALVVGGEQGGDLFFQQAAADAELLDGVEVAQKGHVGINGVGALVCAAFLAGLALFFGLGVELLGRAHQGQAHPQQQGLDIATRC